MAGGNVPAQYAPVFGAAGKANRIPPAVLAGIASVESNFGQNQGPSSAGAVGWMQFLPSTAKAIGVNPLDPRQAIFGAAKLLNQYGYQQNPTRAIAAYNAGPGNYQAGLGYAQQVLAEAKRVAGQLGPSAVLVDGATRAPPGQPMSPGPSSVPVTTFDQQGYQQAQRQYLVGNFLRQSSSSPYDTAKSNVPDPNAGLAKLLPTVPPVPQDYTSTQQVATSRLQKLAGTSLANVHAGAAGDVNPIPGAVIGRTDMGVDANLKPGAPIFAPNAAKVVAVTPNWYRGQPYVAIQFTAGPNRGKVMYVAEQVSPNVKVGQTLGRGAVIGRYAPSGTGIEIGWADPRNPARTLAQATTGYSEGQVTQAGSNFRSYLGHL